jgi:hypothetical protein
VFGDEYRHYQGSSQKNRPLETEASKVTVGARLTAWTTKYRERGEVERIVPIVFALIYTAELIRQVTG